jgi:WD40 repeat protein
VSGARTTIGEKDAIISLTVSPDGKRLAAGTWQGEVSLWDWATGQRTHQFLPHPGLTYGLVFSADGKHLVTGGSDQVIRFWETGKTNPVATLHGHSSQIWSLNLSRDGQSLVSASKDGMARLWSTNLPEARHRACALPTNAIPLGSLPDGSALVTVDELSKAIQLWSLPGFLLVRSLAREEFDREGCRNVQAFPASETVVGATPSGTMHLWDLRTGAHLRQVTTHETNVAPQALAPDKRWLFAHLPGGGKALFDLRGGQPVRLFPEGRSTAAFSRDGHWLAYDTQKNTIKVWDLEACGEQATLEGHRWRVLSLEFSPDGRILASGGADDDLWLWSVAESKARLPALKGHQEGVGPIVFSSDGKTLVTGSEDLTIRWWNVATGQEMLRLPDATLVDHIDHPTPSEWDLGGKLLVWRGRDGVIRLTTLPTLTDIDAAEQARSRAP